MTIDELIGALRQAAKASPAGMSTQVYLDTGDDPVSRVELDSREDGDGPWLALVAGETVWS